MKIKIELWISFKKIIIIVDKNVDFNFKKLDILKEYFYEKKSRSKKIVIHPNSIQLIPPFPIQKRVWDDYLPHDLIEIFGGYPPIETWIGYLWGSGQKIIITRWTCTVMK